MSAPSPITELDQALSRVLHPTFLCNDVDAKTAISIFRSDLFYQFTTNKILFDGKHQQKIYINDIASITKKHINYHMVLDIFKTLHGSSTSTKHNNLIHSFALDYINWPTDFKQSYIELTKSIITSNGYDVLNHDIYPEYFENQNIISVILYESIPNLMCNKSISTTSKELLLDWQNHIQKIELKSQILSKKSPYLVSL